MRRAVWMALAFMGTAPLVALAQQNAGGQGAGPGTPPPAASPSGAASIERGQDTAGTDLPGAPGQQSAGSTGTATGEPATGGAGTAGAGPTYHGTTVEEPPSATPPVDVGTQVGPEPNERVGTAGTGARGAGGSGTGGGGQAAAQQAPVPRSPEAMQRELLNLRQRVARLESEVDSLRGTGGGGTAGTGTTGTPSTAGVQVQGPVTLAITTFDGRVVDVTPRHIDIVDTSDGSFYRLAINDRTKAFVGPRLNRIPVQRLSEGTPVRTSFAFTSTGDQQALNIVAQPQRPQQQQQGSQQRQQGRQQQRQERRGPEQQMSVPPGPSR